MKLSRLRLIGFKSFVEPTEISIEPGLTGIVGPNGCGKSNLVEALRWVMGEASHKAMRAADMDDVIFAGSTSRPPRNTGEVMLFLDNSDRTAPAQFNEQDALEVSRRIEREAGSTYRVNGREVRARDVQILFADASTGARSPALVHQGRIGEIVQAKPEQRRRVLEEAAGVAGLHARRHEAELRLNAAEHNLGRLDDVIAQLAAQIDALKRQARQAVRYRAVSAGVRKAEATLCHLRWLAANAQVAEAERAKDLGVRLVAEATGTQAEASRHQALAVTSLPPLREAEAKAAHRCSGSILPATRSNARRRAPRSASPSSICGSCSSPRRSSASAGSRRTRTRRSFGWRRRRARSRPNASRLRTVMARSRRAWARRRPRSRSPSSARPRSPRRWRIFLRAAISCSGPCANIPSV